MKLIKLSAAFVALMLSMALYAAPMVKVNINTASAAEMAEQLKGISNVKASLIVKYREDNGPFKRVEDIVLVRGIGAKTYQRLREQLTVDNEVAATN